LTTYFNKNITLPYQTKISFWNKEKMIFFSFIFLFSLLPLHALSPSKGSHSFTTQDPFYSQHILEDFCAEVEKTYKTLKWQKSHCREIPWKFNFLTTGHKPLVYFEFDGTHPHIHSKKKEGCLSTTVNTTLILGGVHADELTPVHLAFRLAYTLYTHPHLYQGLKVIIAPLVNPDSFFRTPQLRTNAHGVDLNRNLPTEHWKDKAILNWIEQYKKDPRKNPGLFPNSEVETQFQVALISRYNPDKIISIHAPLSFLDLDYEVACQHDNAIALDEIQNVFKLKKKFSEISRHRIQNFKVFEGSLGKYAGQERGIPTFTLELSTSNPRAAEQIWKNFSRGLYFVIKYDLKKNNS
jgi:protein MpaA